VGSLDGRGGTHAGGSNHLAEMRVGGLAGGINTGMLVFI